MPLATKTKANAPARPRAAKQAVPAKPTAKAKPAPAP